MNWLFWGLNLVLRQINIDIAHVDHEVTSSQSIARKLQIENKKQVINKLRNQLLGKALLKEIQDDLFSQTEHGKPFLPHYPNFSFNHSHSQKHYALATSAQVRDLGVDIEDLDRKVRFDALAKHAFHQDEYQIWQSANFDPMVWFKIWTTKEAVLKASGLGIRLNLNELNTQVHAFNDGGRCEHSLIGIFAYQNFNLGQAMLTVAWRSEDSCKGFAFPTIQINLLG